MGAPLNPRLLPLLALWPAVLAAAEPDRRVLVRDRLQVEVMEPLAPGRYHTGVRFSPLAAVLQVRWDGVPQLSCPEPHDPRSAHAGLAQEFDSDTRGGPPGFAQAALGEGYLKIGVGVLEKSGPAYHFSNQDRLLAPAASTVAWRADGASFAQTCAGPGGFAYRLEVELCLDPDPGAGEVRIASRLANTGTRPIASTQYAHNFLRPGDRAPAAGWSLRVDAPVRQVWYPKGERSTRALVELGGDGLRLLAAPDEALPFIFLRWFPLAGEALPPSVTLRAPEADHAITAWVEGLPVVRMAVFADRDCLCPEQFVPLALAPGEEVAWTRGWRFGGTAAGL